MAKNAHPGGGVDVGVGQGYSGFLQKYQSTHSWPSLKRFSAAFTSPGGGTMTLIRQGDIDV